MAGNIDHRIGGPARLVKVEGVLANLPVVGNQPLVIAAGGVAFFAIVRGEIKPIPDQFAPQEWPRFHLRPSLLMKQILVFLGVVRAGVGRFADGVFTVLPDARSGAVLGNAHLAAWIGGVEIVGPWTEVGRDAVVPAVI